MVEEISLETTQYLTFNLDDETFAVDIAKVREVLEFTKITKVPQTLDMMLGVINLRGSVVPVIDLRTKFGLGYIETTINSCIIIVEIPVDDSEVLIGILVDSVQEVMDLDAEHIEPLPNIGMQLKTDFIKGMGKRDDQFIIILDIKNWYGRNYSIDFACINLSLCHPTECN